MPPSPAPQDVEAVLVESIVDPSNIACLLKKYFTEVDKINVDLAKLIRSQSYRIPAGYEIFQSMACVAPYEENGQIMYYRAKVWYPIRTRYLGRVTGYQPIKDQYFLIRPVPENLAHPWSPINTLDVCCLTVPVYCSTMKPWKLDSVIHLQTSTIFFNRSLPVMIWRQTYSL